MSAVLEKANELPDSWEQLAIEDVAEVNPRVNKSNIPDDLTVSFVPMPAVEAESGVIDVSQERPFSEVKKGFTPFKEGDVLFAKITPCMENGKMAVVPNVKNGYGFGSTEFHVLRPKEGIQSKYIYYFVSSRTFRGVAQHNMSGAVGQKRVPTNYLKQHLIPVAPPEQQKRIVAKIEELFSHIDAGIEALKKAKQLLKQYRQSVLKAAVTGELTKEWREENKDKLEPTSQLLERIIKERKKFYEEKVSLWESEVEKWKDCGSEGGKPKKPQKIKLELDISSNTEQDSLIIPDEWLKLNLDFLVSKLGDGLHGTPTYSDGEYYFINGNNLNEGEIVIKPSTKTVSKEESEKHFRPLSERTVLVSINGTLGNIAFYSGEKVMLGKSACYFNLIYGVSKEYIRWILESVKFQNYIEKTATGSTIKNVPLKAMREFIIPLCSLAEQEEVVSIVKEKIEAIKRLEVELVAQHKKAEKNKQSILTSAFSGMIN